MTSADSIAKNFDKYFTEIDPNLANKISTPLAILIHISLKVP